MEKSFASWASQADRAALMTLWRAGFPEDPALVVERTLDRLLAPETCLVLRAAEDGREQVVSMAFLLPASLCMDGRELPIQYLYAVTTLPTWRGRGLGGQLLREAFRRGQEAGYVGSCLHPGEPSLTAYYRRFGYQEALYMTERQLDCGDWIHWPAAETERLKDIQPSCAEKYRQRRDSFLTGRSGWIRWGSRVVEQEVASAQEAGGGVLVGPDGCAVCEPEGECLLLRELLCPPERERTYLRRAIQLWPRRNIRWRRPVRPAEGGESFGLWRGGSEEFCSLPRGAYLGLALD